MTFHTRAGAEAAKQDLQVIALFSQASREAGERKKKKNEKRESKKKKKKEGVRCSLLAQGVAQVDAREIDTYTYHHI